jgi:hypothetical protein
LRCRKFRCATPIEPGRAASRQMRALPCRHRRVSRRSAPARSRHQRRHRHPNRRDERPDFRAFRRPEIAWPGRLRFSDCQPLQHRRLPCCVPPSLPPCSSAAPLLLR